MKQVNVKRLFEDAKLPSRAFPTEAGLDLHSREMHVVYPNEGIKVSTGVAFDIPTGYYAHIHTRSSMAKKGFVVVGGVCDSSYKGEYFVVLRNISSMPLTIDKYDKIAQVVIYPIVTPEVIEVTDIGTSERGDGAFGSTGR